MTRVLIIEPAGNLWGSERALLGFAGWMPGMEVAVCCPPRSAIIPELERRSIRVFPFFIAGLHEKGRLQRVKAAIGVVRACLQFRPDVIHLNQAGCYQVALPAALLFSLPIIVHVRIYDDVAYLASRRRNPRWLRGIVAISESIAQQLRSQSALSDIPQHVLYDSYAVSQSPARSNGAESKRDRITCVGRIAPIKGQDLLIEAVHRLAAKGTAIDCLLIGDGPSDFVQKLKTAAAVGPGARCFHWLGIREDVLSLMATCAVLVCPSHKEPLGRVILEAWDAGAIPVACRTSAGAAEIISAGDGGLLYAEQSVESLSNAILEALRLPRERAVELIGNGRSWMSRHCDPATYGATIAKIFGEAAKLHRS